MSELRRKRRRQGKTYVQYSLLEFEKRLATYPEFMIELQNHAMGIRFIPQFDNTKRNDEETKWIEEYINAIQALGKKESGKDPV